MILGPFWTNGQIRITVLNYILCADPNVNIALFNRLQLIVRRKVNDFGDSLNKTGIFPYFPCAVEFSNEEYKVRQIQGQTLLYSKEWYFVTKIVLTYCEKNCDGPA